LLLKRMGRDKACTCAEMEKMRDKKEAARSMGEKQKQQRLPALPAKPATEDEKINAIAIAAKSILLMWMPSGVNEKTTIVAIASNFLVKMKSLLLKKKGAP